MFRRSRGNNRPSKMRRTSQTPSAVRMSTGPAAAAHQHMLQQGQRVSPCSEHSVHACLRGSKRHLPGVVGFG